MGIPIKLEAFQGPLDLLLHLIEKNKVNIYEIPIVLITEQYIEYIGAMASKDLDIMSEFLVMAATLLNIKSKMLLPKEEKQEGEEEDPRKELIERLLEYKMYKYISYELKDRQVDALKIMFKKPFIPEELQNVKETISTKELLSDLTLSKLYYIFQSVIKKHIDKIDPIRSKFGEIEREEISLSDCINKIELFAQAHKKFGFQNLLTKKNSKMEIVVTFLGILELIKIGKIKVIQDNSFDDIIIFYQ